MQQKGAISVLQDIGSNKGTWFHPYICNLRLALEPVEG
jgi:hypothetical protein